MATIEILTLPKEFRSLKPQVFFVGDLGSTTHADYRQQLRQLLQHNLASHKFAASEQLLDLQILPNHEQLSLNISHSLKASTFGWCEKPSSLGIDIESADRLSPQVLKRVCSLEEIESCPYIPHLWTAKEATFKSLRKENIVISNVEVLDWRPKTETEWFFTAQWKDQGTHITGIGFSCLKMDHSLSFFVHRP